MLGKSFLKAIINGLAHLYLSGYQQLETLQSLRTDRSNGASGPRTIDYDNGKSFRSRRFPVIGDTVDTRDGKPVKGTVE